MSLLSVLPLVCGADGPAVSNALRRIPPLPPIEIPFELPGVTAEPFLAEVWVRFAPDGGDSVRVPAFYDGSGIWKVRFSPKRPGRYRLQVSAGPAGRERPVEVRNLRPDPVVVHDAPAWDFVRLDPARAQRFKLDSGEPYFPIGLNANLTVWNRAHVVNAELFGQYFRRMSETGFNYARIFAMFHSNRSLFDRFIPQDDPAARARALALPPLKPGEFDLDVARFWDALFVAAREQGIRLQVCLDPGIWGSQNYGWQWHGKHGDRTLESWKTSSWNVRNGGFLADLRDLAVNPRARQLFKARNRYFIARWGYSPALMALDLCSEPQFATVERETPGSLETWHRDMVAYLREIDPYGHLITTGSDLKIAYPFVDYYQPHSYPCESLLRSRQIRNLPVRSPPTPYHSIVNHFTHRMHSMMPGAPTGDPWNIDKPAFFGEMSILKVFRDDAGDNRPAVTPAEEFRLQALCGRRMLWESVFAGAAGSGMLWDSSGWALHHDRWALFRPVCRFVELARIAHLDYRPTPCAVSGSNLVGHAMAAPGAAAAYLFHTERVEEDTRACSELVADLRLTVRRAGPYSVTWFDPVSGNPSTQAVHSAKQGVSGAALSMTTPAFRRDIAVCAFSRERRSGGDE